jgi:hypothetical protein
MSAFPRLLRQRLAKAVRDHSRLYRTVRKTDPVRLHGA